jgi:hypothetical protein
LNQQPALSLGRLRRKNIAIAGLSGDGSSLA